MLLKTKRLLIFFLAFTCFAVIAQTNTTEKTKQKKQDEQGAALKKWFDGGTIIVDATAEIAVDKYGNSACIKMKVNRVLKGNFKTGYFNLKVDFARVAEYEGIKIIEYMSGVHNLIQLKYRYLIKIKKTDITQEGYITENNGVYEKDGDAKIINTNEVELYQQLQDYCGVKTEGLEKKSSNITKQQIDNALLYQHRVKKHIELKQFAQNQAQKNKLLNSTSSTTQCVDLFISEQLDGQSSNNAVEIYNPTASAISLSNYKLLLYHNASLTPTSIALTGTISAYGTHVVAEQGASAAILAHANQTSNNLNFNGNVCTVLSKGSVHIDKIGEIGLANAAGNWTLTPSGGTNNSDIRRIYAVGAGDTSWTNCKSEWNVFPMDSISNIGHHQNHCAVDPDLNVGLANAYSVDSSNGKSYFEFDIIVNSAGTANTYLDFTEVDLTYDTAALGPNVVANNKITVVRGPLFNSNTYADPQSNLAGGVDSISIIFSSNHSAGSWNRTAVTTSTVRLMRVFIEVGNRCNHNVNVDFFNTFISGFETWFDNGAGDDPNNSANNISYDNVYYIGNPLNYTKPCTGGVQITSMSPDSVIAGAWYTGIVNNEAELTINGSGFGGTAKPTVLMRNAVNNSAPFYIALDDYDITSWSNTQIVINVPSVFFPSNPFYSNAGYPGTGLIKVIPNGTTDTAVSSSPVYIPYALRNVTNGVSKRRVGFAYHLIADSLAFHPDTAAYDFRFDASTIGNPSVTNANCRPLLKQAIHDWQCGLPIRYRIGRDTTFNDTLGNGISYITFKPTLSNANFAAETGLKVLQCTSTITYFSNEADISFKTNPGFPWQYENPSNVPTGSPTPSLPSSGPDFFSVALHELGHATLMLHVNQTSDLMYYKVPASGVGPYISYDDKNGGLDNKNWSKTFNFSTCYSTTGAITVPAAGAEICVDPSTGEVGIEDINATQLQLTVYPNPAGSYLNVTFKKDKESSNTVKLTNTLGQTIFYRNIGKNEGANEVINLAGFAKGIYILIVTDNQNTITKKIIVE
ncbi:MAG TPA: T9SS type A sorting domain-containing protein, partial [Bacteroidia bacterium]|nr:T9SS type A sorting domain-containing protein [Bacteroidia bacterium]